MADIEFIEEETTSLKRPTQPTQPAASESKLVNFLIRKGIAKTESQANIILIVGILIGAVIIIYLNFGRG